MYKWCVIVPVNLNYKDVDNCINELIEFGNGVVLAKAPEWFKKFSKDRVFDEEEKQLIEMTKFTLSIEYEAEDLNDPDHEWQEEKPRSKRDKALQQIQHTNLALWIVKPTCLGFKLVIDAQSTEDGWILMYKRKIDGFVPHVRYKKHFLCKENFVEAKNLISSLNNACAIRGPIWRSSVTLYWALTNEYWDHRYLLLWIALESLFCPTDRKKITQRMSKRIAYFLAEDVIEAQNLYRTAKNGYRCRCHIVHGGSLSNAETKNSEQISYDAEELVRQSLKCILDDDRLIEMFNSKKRECYLGNLVPSEFNQKYQYFIVKLSKLWCKIFGKN